MSSFAQAARDAEQKILSASYAQETRGDVAIATAILAHAHAMSDIAKALVDAAELGPRR